MRHRVYGKKLGLSKNERTALFRKLVQALFVSESIQITQTRAKAIKGLVDTIITQAKSPSTRRLVSQFLTSKKVEEKLIKNLLPRLKDRQSGYTSVVKLGSRLGDNTMMVKMSLLLEKEPKKELKEEEKKKGKVKK